MKKIDDLWYSNFITKLQEEGKSQELFIIKRIDSINKLEKNLVKKAVEIYHDIMELNSDDETTQNLEKVFNFMLSQLAWFDAFKIDQYIKGDKEVIDLIKCADLIENRETYENISMFEEKIRKYHGDDNVKGLLGRKLTIFKKRLDRGLSSSIGPIILQARKDMGYTLDELSAKTGYSASYINRIEKSERKTPTIGVLNKIADALHLDLQSLLSVSTIDESELEVKSVGDVLLGNNFSFLGKKVTETEKIRLVKWINFLLENKIVQGKDIDEDENETIFNMLKFLKNGQEKIKKDTAINLFKLTELNSNKFDMIIQWVDLLINNDFIKATEKRTVRNKALISLLKFAKDNEESFSYKDILKLLESMQINDWDIQSITTWINYLGENNVLGGNRESNKRTKVIKSLLDSVNNNECITDEKKLKELFELIEKSNGGIDSILKLGNMSLDTESKNNNKIDKQSMNIVKLLNKEESELENKEVLELLKFIDSSNGKFETDKDNRKLIELARKIKK